MSFIQVDLKVIEVQGPAMARALGVDEKTVLAGLLRLWHRCWSLKTDTITAIEVRGFIPHQDACATMEAFGFLASVGDEKWRVKGADTYLRVRDSRSKGGVARAASAGRSAGKFTSRTPAQHQQDTSTAPALTPNTEHRTPNTKKDSAHHALVGRLCETFRSLRGADYPFSANPGRNGKAVKEMLGAAEPDAIDAAWRKALGSQVFPRVSTLWELQSNLAHFVGATSTDWRSRVDPNAPFWPEGEEPQ